MNALADPVTPVDARPTPDATSPGAGPREFLTFKLASEEYGMDILRVQEIRSYEQPTRIANARPCVLGVINLRGEIVPIVDIRIAFHQPQVRYDDFTVVIVLKVDAQTVGLVVDGVSDVISLAPGQLQPVPAIASTAHGDYLLAIASLEARTLILLAIEKLVRSPELGLVQPGMAQAWSIN